MPIVAGQRLWNRQQINVPVGATDIPHGLQQQNLAIDPSVPASIMVVPLPPIGNWTNISIGEPGAVNVPFFNSGGGGVDLNVLFWLPHTVLGAGDSVPYLPPCFDGATTVWTPSGALPISQLSVGDEVLAWDHKASAVVPKRILQVHRHTADHTRKLGELRTTDNHPFLIEGDHWVPVGALIAEDRVRSMNGLEALGPTERINGDVEVWNVEVEDLHTYFVGERKLLVHNK